MIFHGTTMAMAAMNMVSAGVFGGKLSFKKMSARGSLCTLQENPHFGSRRSKLEHLTVFITLKAFKDPLSLQLSPN